jgi:hypothetical protein
MRRTVASAATRSLAKRIGWRESLLSPWGPVLLALAFGFVSIPFVAAAFVQPLPGWQQEIVDAPRVSSPDAFLLAWLQC